jgi:hypothetical protein
VTLLLSIAGSFTVRAGQVPGNDEYRVLSPLVSGNLTIFPVVARDQHSTSSFLTLDEAIRSGEVVVTESGSVQPLMRGHRPMRPRGDAQVNTLVLVNNSKRPLLLLAGEIVTGGKQDRVIGKDRIVPAESDPIDLGVFCVEPGRWVAHSDNFSVGTLAQPKVRAQAMASKNQQEVWNSVRDSQAKATETVEVQGAVAGIPAAPPRALAELHGTTSYAKVMDNSEVKKQTDKIIEPIQRSYQSLIHELRAKNAVGVVAAVNGQILWADIFASPDLLERYWPKLIRSYAAEAMTAGNRGGQVTESEAQAFLNQKNITHETAETEPGVFRHAEMTGSDVKVFELTSLLPKMNFPVHTAIMHDETVAWKIEPRPLVRR